MNVTRILIFLPILGLILNMIAWLQYGVDLPYYDDWADYANQKAGSFEWQHLFKAYNDTFFPVGRVLDAFVQRVFAGNTLLYQFLSMIFVLGAILWLQWRLLIRALSNRLWAACAFSFTLFMLMPGSYWGLQNQAYIQALPLVFILSAIYLTLGREWNQQWSGWAILVLGLLSGASYTSGAFAALSVSIIFLFASRFIDSSERKPLVIAGWALLLAGLITALPQIWVVLGIQKGLHTHTQLGLPTESAFWIFLLGKIGRALIPLPYFPELSFILVIAVVLFASWVFFLFCRWFIKGQMRTLQEARTAIIYITLLGMIFVYLSLISASRVYLYVTPSTPWIETFAFGFHRIHYFWVTLLWPWLAAAGFFIAMKLHSEWMQRTILYWVKICLGFALALTLVIAIGNVLLYRIFTKVYYDKHVTCLLSEIQKGRGINCPTLYPVDLSQAFVYARGIDASFTRYFPVLPIAMGADSPQPLFRLSKIAKTASVFSFKTEASASLKQCLILDVSARLRGDAAVQLFYTVPSPMGGSIEAASKIIPIPARVEKSFTDIVFQIDSQVGFLDKFELRSVEKPHGLEHIVRFRDLLQPKTITNPPPFDIKDIEVRCRLFPLNSSR